MDPALKKKKRQNKAKANPFRPFFLMDLHVVQQVEAHTVQAIPTV
jgi:hypothetical protein